MAHDIEIDNSGARMAFAGEVPWHRLGKQMNGLQTIDSMLEAARADFDVRLTCVAAVDEDGNLILNPDGTPVIIEDSRATVRVNQDGSADGLATVGTRFHVKQNREITERALAVIGASHGDAVMDTMGVLDGGREFFASIDLGTLVIDPTGVNDRIARYLLVRNGHNGKVPITYANTNIRAVCRNTVIIGVKGAERIFRARHTANADTALDDAQKVLEISTEWAKQFKLTAEQMLAIPTPASSGRIDRVLNSVFPEKGSETDRQKNNRLEVHALVRGIYGNTRNSANYGENGWSLYNSVVEYLDHFRDAKPDERALTSMDENSWVSKTKLATQAAVFALV